MRHYGLPYEERKGFYLKECIELAEATYPSDQILGTFFNKSMGLPVVVINTKPYYTFIYMTQSGGTYTASEKDSIEFDKLARIGKTKLPLNYKEQA